MDNLQYAELFLTESREHVSAVNLALLELERDSSAATASQAVGSIFRAVHTIKGMGATMGYAIVAELAHELETVLDRIRRNDLAIDAEIMDVLFRSADVLEQAVEKYTQLKPDLVTMDIVMPDMGGIDAVREICKLDPQARILMCSAMGQQALVVEAIQAGAKDFVVKPFQPSRVLEAVQRVLG